MPFIQLETNIKVEDSKTLVTKLSKLSSRLLGRPESLILVKYTHNEALCFDGTFEPAFCLQAASLGDFSPEKNPGLIAEYTAFLKENLPGADDKRGFVVFHDPGPDSIGFTGTTIAQLLKKAKEGSQ
ncbi:Tautomerase/MIF [Schizopora paradoxa]|uniref:L-dopachrome isomerase n=1 Tax=Schizopora paradoxa TaxID=27342 RepID=A0A0H2SAU7_9AGAM|nr:Tautomerase/MIF [Schizopora paradoxa]